MKFSFPATERLKSKKQIESLFESGRTVVQFPIKAWFLPATETKVAFAVPKRSFKRAVDRNRIKRQMREAYRLNKPSREQESQHHHILLLYMDKQAPDYSRLAKSMKQLLDKLGT